MIDAIADVTRMLYFVKEIYQDSERLVFTVFHCSRIEWFVEICKFCKKNALIADFFYFFKWPLHQS